MRYLDTFMKKLEKDWKGSLVSVSEAAEVDKNAKKFLSLLAQQGNVQRVTWGWYWIPDDYEGFFDFLAKDKHLKVLQKQSAASYWNGDFVHRDHYTLAVDNGSYGKALEKFAQGRGWNVHVEVRNVEQLNYQETDGMCVEGLEETIVDCLKEWAFADAFAVWYENQKNWPRIMERYWERILAQDHGALLGKNTRNQHQDRTSLTIRSKHYRSRNRQQHTFLFTSYSHRRLHEKANRGGSRKGGPAWLNNSS